MARIIGQQRTAQPLCLGSWAGPRHGCGKQFAAAQDYDIDARTLHSLQTLADSWLAVPGMLETFATIDKHARTSLHAWQQLAVGLCWRSLVYRKAPGNLETC